MAVPRGCRHTDLHASYPIFLAKCVQYLLRLPGLLSIAIGGHSAAGDAMVKLLDSYMVHCGVSLRPGRLKITLGTYMCMLKIPRRIEEKRLQCDNPSWGLISPFLFHCLFSVCLQQAHAYYGKNL